MDVAIIGAGYVGLSTAVGLAKLGHKTVLIDVDENKVKAINAKKSPIVEEGIDEALQEMVPERIYATTSYSEGITDKDVIFIAVGTPSREDGSIDLRYIKEASRMIGQHLKDTNKYVVIVVKSTVVPTTTENVVLPIIEESSSKKAGVDFGIVMNPEFLREGKALEDFLKPDRIVIGYKFEKDLEVMRRLYSKIEAPLLEVPIKTAEMIKYASNAFLAQKISFINEIGNICKILGIDVYDVAKGVGLDHRISPHFLNAGIGFGGSCLSSNEVIFIGNKDSLKPVKIKEVFSLPYDGGDIYVLGFNTNTMETPLVKVKYFTKRDFTGKMITIKLEKDKKIRVTDDHPMVVFDNGEFKIKLARDIEIGDNIPTIATISEYKHAINHKVRNKFVLLPVRRIEVEEVNEEVYSLELNGETNLFVTSNGIIVHNCFPKDVKALIATAKTHNYDPIILKSTIEVNEKQPYKLIEIAKKKIESFEGKDVVVLGLAFKPGTDDMREAPSIKIINKLLEEGANITAYDPAAIENAKKIFGEKIKYAKNVNEALSASDIVFVVTEWDEFKNPELYRGKIVFDGRRVLDPRTATKYCAQYDGVCW